MGIPLVVFCDACQFRCKSKYKTRYIKAFKKFRSRTKNRQIFLILKYYYLTDVYKFITVAVFIVISILEGVRLYLGYLGNLAEKVIYSIQR